MSNAFVISTFGDEGGVNDVVKSIIECLVDAGFNVRHCYVEGKKILNKTKEGITQIGNINNCPPLIWPIMLNKAVSTIAENDDLLISVNGITYGLKGHMAHVCYCHFSSYSAYIYQSRFVKGCRRFYRLIAGIFYKYIEQHQYPQVLLFNSKYTMNNSKHMKYMVKKDILYPPVNASDQIYIKKEKRDPKMVVSLGRISPEKDQLLQIRIASKLPEYTFILLGFADEKSQYYKIVRSAASRLNNVHVMPNVSQATTEEYLRKSTYYLHTMKGEHFGISILQAVIAGCIPIIHKDGGAQEVLNGCCLKWENELDILRYLKLGNTEMVLIDEKCMQDIIDITSKASFKRSLGTIVAGVHSKS